MKLSNTTYTRIDSHQHFWHYNAIKHDWIDDAMAAIRQDFLPADLAPILAENNIAGCIAVQADQTENETDFLLQLAADNPIIQGIVGWVDLKAPNIAERLGHYAQHKAIKGFRHVLQGEEPGFMLEPAFVNGIGTLASFGFTYDLLIFPKHLAAATTLVRQFPEQAFVIDHLAKPAIKAGLISEWQQGIQEIATCKNVCCKISGMVTEADYHSWKQADFTPYLDTVTEAFGPARLLYGSDWPVCQVAGNYGQVLGIAERYFQSFSATEQAMIFGDNARRFYHL